MVQLTSGNMEVFNLLNQRLVELMHSLTFVGQTQLDLGQVGARMLVSSLDECRRLVLDKCNVSQEFATSVRYRSLVVEDGEPPLLFGRQAATYFAQKAQAVEQASLIRSVAARPEPSKLPASRQPKTKATQPKSAPSLQDVSDFLSSAKRKRAGKGAGRKAAAAEGASAPKRQKTAPSKRSSGSKKAGKKSG